MTMIAKYIDGKSARIEALAIAYVLLVYGDYDFFKWVRPRDILRDVLPKW